MLITQNELIDMFERQADLNVKYNGTDWKSRMTSTMIQCAILDEVGEFLREIETEWRWWKFDKNEDKQKALFEYIDILHFMMVYILYDKPLHNVDIEITNIDLKIFSAKIEDRNAALRKFVTAIRDFSYYVDNGDWELPFLASIQAVSSLLNLEDGDIYKAYLLKNKQNHKRVEGGLLEGKYDKAQEEELKL